MKRNVKRALKTIVKHSGKKIYYYDEGSTVIICPIAGNYRALIENVLGVDA